jgi:predicted small lipoprotein YifL
MRACRIAESGPGSRRVIRLHSAARLRSGALGHGWSLLAAGDRGKARLRAAASRSRLRFAILPLLMSLTACAVGPDYVPPAIEVPQRWSAAVGQQDLAADRANGGACFKRSDAEHCDRRRRLRQSRRRPRQGAHSRSTRDAGADGRRAVPAGRWFRLGHPLALGQHDPQQLSAPASTPPGSSTCSALAIAPSRPRPMALMPPTTISTRPC